MKLPAEQQPSEEPWALTRAQAGAGSITVDSVHSCPIHFCNPICLCAMKVQLHTYPLRKLNVYVHTLISKSKIQFSEHCLRPSH